MSKRMIKKEEVEEILETQTSELIENGYTRDIKPLKGDI